MGEAQAIRLSVRRAGDFKRNTCGAKQLIFQDYLLKNGAIFSAY
jgi:hypothetical protein